MARLDQLSDGCPGVSALHAHKGQDHDLYRYPKTTTYNAKVHVPWPVPTDCGFKPLHPASL